MIDYFKQKAKANIRKILQRLFRFCQCIVVPTEYEISDEYQPVHMPMKFNRLIPKSVDSLHYKFFAGAKGITEQSEMTFVKHLYNIRVFSSSGIVISKKNRIISESARLDKNISFLFSNYFICKIKMAKGKSIVIAANNADTNYFHWMTDALPKICISEKAGYFLRDIDYVLVSNDLYPYHQETLEHLGITEYKRISLTQYPLIYCSELIMPSSTCLSGNVPGWIIDFLRERFRKWMRHDSTLPSKIFVSRKKGTKRVLLNEEAVKDILKPYSYEKVYLEDLTIEQQVLLFFNAKEIIGVHGAGLTNLIFSQQGCCVIELFPVTYVNQCYWTIASYNKLNYSYLLGEGEDVANKENHLIDSNFSISIAQLIELRKKILNV